MVKRNKLLISFVLFGAVGLLTCAGTRFLPESFSFSKRSTRVVPISIGVVDINRIKSDSKVFQKFKEMFDERNARVHKEILERETKLRSEYEQLKQKEEESKGPTQEILNQKAELDKKIAKLEKLVRVKKEELDEDYTRVLIGLKQSLQAILKDLGKTYNLTVILNKSLGDGTQMDQSVVLFGSEGLDLTTEVIQRLDAQVSVRNLGRF